MKTLTRLLLALALVGAAGACTDQRSYQRAVYVLVDTSGTYAKELDKAHKIINYLLGTLNPGDTLAVARVKSRSFTEKDIIAKVTFVKDPMKVNAQKLAFKKEMAKLTQEAKKGSAYTDITGGILQAAEFLNETGAGRKTILIFSDMQEELDDKTVRSQVPLNLKGISVIALNVTKLTTDNIDPRRYMGRLAKWEKRVREAGAKEWRMVNDLERLDRIFES
ncbi:MAG TPA: VWA domain-containing protein [Burkholderiales bacterium]